MFVHRRAVLAWLSYYSIYTSSNRELQTKVSAAPQILSHACAALTNAIIVLQGREVTLALKFRSYFFSRWEPLCRATIDNLFLCGPTSIIANETFFQCSVVLRYAPPYTSSSAVRSTDRSILRFARCMATVRAFFVIYHASPTLFETPCVFFCAGYRVARPSGLTAGASKNGGSAPAVTGGA